MKPRWRTGACLLLCGLLIWFLADAGTVRAAAAAGQAWAVPLLLIGWGVGTRAVYHRRLRRFRRRMYENRYGKWKKYESGDDGK